MRHPSRTGPLKLQAGRHAQHFGDIVEEEGVRAGVTTATCGLLAAAKATAVTYGLLAAAKAAVALAKPAALTGVRVGVTTATCGLLAAATAALANPAALTDSTFAGSSGTGSVSTAAVCGSLPAGGLM